MVLNENMLDYYAQRAHEYENVVRQQNREKEVELIISHLKTAYNLRTVLEIACGTGFWTEYYSPAANSVLATDINQEVLEIAKAKKYSAQNVEFKIADIYSLAEIPNNFECGFASLIISHVPMQNFKNFLETFHTKIKAGGKIILIDNLYVEGVNAPIKKVDEYGNTWQIRTLSDDSKHWVMKNFFTHEILYSYLKDSVSSYLFNKYKYYWMAEYTLK